MADLNRSVIRIHRLLPISAFENKQYRRVILFMDETLKLIVAVIVALLASSGFWSYLNSCRRKDTAERRLLKGLAHDRILYLANQYLQRGDWITVDEYENLHDYLFIPYTACNGNGTAEKLMMEVKAKLRIVRETPYSYQRACEERRNQPVAEFSISGGM